MKTFKHYPHYERGEQLIKSLIEIYCVLHGKELSNQFKIRNNEKAIHPITNAV